MDKEEINQLNHTLNTAIPKLKQLHASLKVLSTGNTRVDVSDIMILAQERWSVQNKLPMCPPSASLHQPGFADDILAIDLVVICKPLADARRTAASVGSKNA